jgi:hypothetical protein
MLYLFDRYLYSLLTDGASALRCRPAARQRLQR